MSVRSFIASLLLIYCLTDLKTILPLKRYVVPDQFQVQYMVACKDGSSIGHSATLHLVSKGEGKVHCRIVRITNRIKISAAPSNESLGYPHCIAPHPGLPGSDIPHVLSGHAGVSYLHCGGFSKCSPVPQGIFQRYSPYVSLQQVS